MLKINILLAALLLSVTTAGFAHGDHDHNTPKREQAAWQLINHGALIIDARTAQEYAQGHIKAAINIPFDVSVAQFSALEIRKDRKVVIYCRSGNRSGKAVTSLKAAGYTNLHNGGGFKALSAAKK